eukprot:8468025-Ditylum_brightwellii.AAC.1
MASATGTNASSTCATFKMDTLSTTNTLCKKALLKALAVACIKKRTLLLQTNIAQVLNSFSSVHLKLLQKAYSKEKQIQRLEQDPTLIPKSA